MPILRAFRRYRAAKLQLAGDRARDANRWRDAALLYRRSLKAAPHNSRIWVQFGHALKENGDIDEAEVAYRQSIAIEPTADGYLHLGRLLLQQRSFDAAREAFHDALAKADKIADFGDRQRLLGDAYVGLGDAGRERRRWDQALEAYRSAVDIKRLDHGIWVQLGHALKELGNWEQSEAAYRKAVELAEAESNDTYKHLCHVVTQRLRSSQSQLEIVNAGRVAAETERDAARETAKNAILKADEVTKELEVVKQRLGNTDAELQATIAEAQFLSNSHAALEGKLETMERSITWRTVRAFQAFWPFTQRPTRQHGDSAPLNQHSLPSKRKR